MLRRGLETLVEEYHLLPLEKAVHKNLASANSSLLLGGHRETGTDERQQIGRGGWEISTWGSQVWTPLKFGGVQIYRDCQLRKLSIIPLDWRRINRNSNFNF